MSIKKIETILKKYILKDGLDLIVDLEKSKGCHLYDLKTQRHYFDFFTFFSSLPLGMNHPKLLTPEFKEKLLLSAINKPSNSDIYTPEYAAFLDTFSKTALPKEFPHLFFISGGALAVENCLKAAFDWKSKKNIEKNRKKEGSKIIHFKNAFHGRSGYTLSLTNTADPRKTALFPKFNWPRIEAPILNFPTQPTIEKEEKHALSQIKAAIKDSPHEIAALIIEPIQGEGGDNHFRKEFFKDLRYLADELEFLLIFDEVQTGVGLTGKWWCFEHFDVTPDLVSFGKKTQVCGLMGGKRIDEIENNVFRQASRINSTFGGSLVDMVRFTRILEVITEDHLLKNATQMGHYLLKKLTDLSLSFPKLVTNVRGRGLMCAFDFPSKENRDEFLKLAFQNHLIILGCGIKSIRFRPMLTITQNELDEGVTLIIKTLQDLSIKNKI